MNRAEFMKELEFLLQDVTDSEREEALQYYNDYFDDAGPENEPAVIEELDSPEKVAAIIKNGLNYNDREAGEFTETGYSDIRFNTKKEVSRHENPNEKQYEYDKRPKDTAKIILIIVLCLLASPIIVPVGGGILGLCVGIFGGAIGLFVALLVGTIGLLVAGVAVFVIGIFNMLTGPATGLVLTGIGCILFAVGMLLTILVVWICAKLIPCIIRGIVNLFSRLFHRGRV